MIDADCWSCASVKSQILKETGDFAASVSFRMYLCPYCGDKRCDKAENHNRDCNWPRNVTRTGASVTA